MFDESCLEGIGIELLCGQAAGPQGRGDFIRAKLRPEKSPLHGVGAATGLARRAADAR